MKYKTFLPFISNSPFDTEKLKNVLWLLYLKSANNMDAFEQMKYDEYWEIGYKVGGSLPVDTVWLYNKDRLPEKYELSIVLDILIQLIYNNQKTKYSYDASKFFIDDSGYPNRLYGFMFVEFD